MYKVEDLDYIFIRAQSPDSKWNNLSLNEITDKQFVDWASEKFDVKIVDDFTKSWTKEEKVDFLNEMVHKNHGKPVVVMLKH